MLFSNICEKSRMHVSKPFFKFVAISSSFEHVFKVSDKAIEPVAGPVWFNKASSEVLKLFSFEFKQCDGTSSNFQNKNFPNPFNATTTISYDLPEYADVELLIYDIQGRLVNRIVNENQSAGSHQCLWNAVDIEGHPVSTGIYVCQLLAGKYSKTIKMLYLR